MSRVGGRCGLRPRLPPADLPAADRLPRKGGATGCWGAGERSEPFREGGRFSRNPSLCRGGEYPGGVERGLSNRDKAILEFEGSWWLYPGSKDHAIRDYLEMSATRYYQALRRLAVDPLAEIYAPLTVRRLRRLREEARQRRVARRLENRPGG